MAVFADDVQDYERKTADLVQAADAEKDAQAESPPERLTDTSESNNETPWAEDTIAVIQGSDGNYKQCSSLKEAISMAAEGDAIELLSNTIALAEALAVDKSITLTNGVLTRAGNYTGYLLTASTGTLTLTNITLDGENRETIKNALIRVCEGATLVIGEGATLQKNKNSAVYVQQDNTDYAEEVSGSEADGIDYAGGVYTYGGEVVLDGGMVTANVGQLGGGIGAYNGKITIKSGEVSQNMAYWKGGGVYSKYADI